MSKLKKGLAMVMAYFMCIALLPTGLFTVITKAAETGEVPQYLNYNGLYFNSVAQYGDRDLVTYQFCENDPNYSDFSKIFTQLSLFENEKETKVGKYEGYVEKYLETKSEAYYNYGFGDSALKYDFSTGTINNIVDNQEISIDVKNDIVSKVNGKYGTNYSLQSSWINYMGYSHL